jgi:hypothetical protein
MPHLRIWIDGKLAAAIPTSGREIVGARVGGTIDDPDYADLYAWGGTYARGAAVDHRHWLDQCQLVPGQTLEIEFAQEGEEVGVGIPVGPQGEDTPPPNYSIEAEMQSLAAELRSQPPVRAGYRLSYSSSQTQETLFTTNPGDYGFGLNVLWNDMYPDRVRVGLYAYTLDSMTANESSRYGIREKLGVGERCRLAFVA